MGRCLNCGVQTSNEFCSEKCEAIKSDIDDFKKEGFWYEDSEESESYPEPIPHMEKSGWDKEQFLHELPILEDKLLARYNKTCQEFNNGNKNSLEKYRQKYNEVIGYRGSSSCRICGRSNGSLEFRYGGFIWPEGYRHYIENHNIKPSDEFIGMVIDSHF